METHATPVHLPEAPARVRDITGIEVQRLLHKLQVIIPCLQSDLQFGATRDNISSLGFDLQPPMEDMARLSQLRSDCRQLSEGQQLPKHVLQEASIIAHLESCGALPKSCLVAKSKGSAAEDQGSASLGNERDVTCLELGAGTGRLSDSLQRHTNAQFNHVLLDRQSFGKGRSSRDGTMRARARTLYRARELTGDCVGCAHVVPSVRRVVADIAQLELTLPAGARPNIGTAMQPRYCSSCIVRVHPNTHTSAGGSHPRRGTARICRPDAALTFFSHPRHLVLLSKHLCGPACDLAIGALSGALSSAVLDTPGPAPVLQPTPHLSPQLPPLVVATCCHYLCALQSFAGRTMWTALGLGPDDFRVAAAVTQWASMQAKQKVNTAQNRARAEHAMSEIKFRVSQSRPLPDLMSAAQRAGAELKRAEKADTFGTVKQSAATDSVAFERSFSRQQKVALACVMKVLMDLTRAAQLQRLGYSTKLVRYTTCSLENRLLIGTTAT